MTYQPSLPFREPGEGLHEKYRVYRVDETEELEGFFFVLRPYSDPAAAQALQNYVVAITGKNPSLAEDLAPIVEECLDIHFGE